MLGWLYSSATQKDSLPYSDQKQLCSGYYISIYIQSFKKKAKAYKTIICLIFANQANIANIGP